MGRQRGLWFSLECDWDESKWLAQLPWPSRAIWPLIIGRVKLHGRGGVCNAPDLERFARSHDIPVDALRELLEAAEVDNALLVTDETWTVTNWDFYQNLDPTNAERQRRFKEKKRAEKQAFEPKQSTSPPPSNGDNALCNASNYTEQNRTEQNNLSLITPPETPAVTLSPSRATRVRPKVVLDQAWERFCQSYPPRDGGTNRTEAKKKFFQLAKSEFDPETIIEGAERYLTWARASGKAGSPYIAQMTTWLNQHRWRDDFTIPAQSSITSGVKLWTDDDLKGMTDDV